MLHLLKEYAEKHDLVTTPGFTSKDVRWCIVFSESGKFLDIVELGDAEKKRNRGQTFKKCPELSQPHLKARGITKCHFLIETAEVVLLFSKNPDDVKIKAKHDYFIKMLRDAGEFVPEFKDIADTLDAPQTLEATHSRLEELKAKPTEKITLKIGSKFPVESDAWHDWWRSFRSGLIPKQPDGISRKKKTSIEMRSFMTGEWDEPAKTHPKIKSLNDVGGLAMGDVLIGFKQDSFCSYGLKQSLNAAVPEKEAYIYADALNHLIKQHSQRMAGAKVVHWFKDVVLPEDDPLQWLMDVDDSSEIDAQRQAKEMLEAIKNGIRPDLHNNKYYSLTLSGASGRVMIRDWIEGRFEELVFNISNWFDDLEIVHREGGHLAKPPKFMAVLGATVRDLKNLNSPFVAKIWRVAVKGEPFPGSALSQSLNRVRVDIINDDSPPNHARMGLLKAYHVRKYRLKGKEPFMKSYLNEEHPHPAYHCGRLMAVLASLQHRVMPNVGVGIVQRYYAAASTTPALILGRITNTSQHHLAKVESPQLVYWYEDKIASIWGRIKDDVPATLTLEEQSLFALGYYQQMADLRTKKSENDNNEEATNE